MCMKIRWFAMGLPVLIILIVFKILLYADTFYAYEFTKNKVYDRLPEADIVKSNIISYFSDDDTLSTYYFTEDEISHLSDVKERIKLVDLLLYLCIIFYVILVGIFARTKKKHKLIVVKEYCISTGIIGLALTFILFITSLSFGKTFMAFHLFFFPEGNFTFPSESTLITLFPEQLFYDFFITLIILSSLTFILMILCSRIHLSKR